MKTWRELIRDVAREAELPEKTARAVLQTLVDVASRSLEEQTPVKLHGLCILQPVWREPRVLRSLHDRRKMFLDGRWTLGVRPASRLRKRLAATTPQRWHDAQHQHAWQLAETLIDDLAVYHPGRIPEGLSEETPDTEVIAGCAEAFGPTWRRAVKTFEAEVPEAVREEGAYLARAARARWGA